MQRVLFSNSYLLPNGLLGH
uniref:Uncharacterized protein n=1 Tax=Arundo donax TaxID=35708 RepID=A0A0A8XPZ1_ARUDO